MLKIKIGRMFNHASLWKIYYTYSMLFEQTFVGSKLLTYILSFKFLFSFFNIATYNYHFLKIIYIYAIFPSNFNENTQSIKINTNYNI